jgi:hypothetical protein
VATLVTASSPGAMPTAPSAPLPPGGVTAVPPLLINPFACPPAPCAPSFLGLLAVATAYLALGVGVGLLLKPGARRRTTIALLLIVPGTLAGVGYLVWVIASLV